VVWLQKLNPLEHEKAIRSAGAARARAMLEGRNRDGEAWQEAYADMHDLGPRETLIDYLIAEEISKRTDAHEAELAFEEEWAKDGYLQGLRDSWEGGLKDRYVIDAGDEEASRVFTELQRFSDQVSAQVEPETADLRRDYDDISDDALMQKAVERFIELRSGLAWLREFRRSEVFYATREIDDHRKYYFTTRDEVDNLASEVFTQLTTAYQELIVDPSEGKDSAKILSSLPSSEPPSVLVT
jgi:hypothetical protein